MYVGGDRAQFYLLGETAGGCPQSDSGKQQ